MIRRKLIVTAAVVGAALALPAVSGAAQTPPPEQDSVVLTGGPVVVNQPFNIFTVFDINATSGPSGENPTGGVRFDVVGGLIRIGGPVTCLAVSGNTATINFQDEMDFSGIILTVQVVDDQPDTFDALPTGRAPTDCSPLPGPGGPLSSGDITVVDALPLPTTRDQCTKGGWKRFSFTNQGQCIAFANHGPK
jgi:hypothetical protein